MSKKIILILGILVVIGVGLFLVFGSKSVEEGENSTGFSLRNFLPFGNNDDLGTENNSSETPTNNEGGGQNLPNTTNQSVPRLRKLSKEPVAGGVVFNTGTTSVVRFVEKGTGNVYEVTSKDTRVERLTNTTIPKIIRAFWLPDGSGFLAQTLMPESEMTETTFVKLVKNTATSSSEILTPFKTILSKLPTDIKEISVKPDGSKIFYYTQSNSSSNWFTANPDGTSATLLTTHSLTEWLPKWATANILFMQTKSSTESMGYVYSFDLNNKSLKKLGFGAAGISTLPNQDATLTLVSSGGPLPSLKALNNANASQTVINASSMADKCVWLKEKSPTVYCAVPNQIPDGNYPDSWYQGLVATEDSLRKIDINNDVYYTLSDLSRESKEKIDATDLSLSKDETHLLFRNKRDGYLWLLRVED